MSLLNKITEMKKDEVQQIDITLIKENQHNALYEVNKIDELAESISINGQIDPIICYLDNEEYVILSGHRRYNAMLLGEYSEINGIVVPKPLNDKEEQLMVIESNRQRIKSKDEIQNEIKIRKEIYTQMKKEGEKKYQNANINKLIADEFLISESTVKRALNSEKVQNEPSPKTEQEKINDKILSLKKYIDKNYDALEISSELIIEIEKHIKTNNQIKLIHENK